jgi:hypothetical protein
VSSNNTPAKNSSLKYRITDEYFNLNPLNFGLNYSIFEQNEVITSTTVLGASSFPTARAIKKRQASAPVPGACYEDCNNCAVEVQQTGKTPLICRDGSAFQDLLRNCKTCISSKQTASTSDFSRIRPVFQQFIDFCAIVNIVSGAAGPASGTAQAEVTASAAAVSTQAASSDGPGDGSGDGPAISTAASGGSPAGSDATAVSTEVDATAAQSSDAGSQTSAAGAATTADAGSPSGAAESGGGSGGSTGAGAGAGAGSETSAGAGGSGVPNSPVDSTNISGTPTGGGGTATSSGPVIYDPNATNAASRGLNPTRLSGTGAWIALLFCFFWI